MPTESQDKSWGQLIKEWVVTFFSGLVKKPNNILIFIIALIGCIQSFHAKDKADAAQGKADSAASTAVVAKDKAENKDLEQASYETLAATIAELQAKVDSVDERLTKLQSIPLPSATAAVRIYTAPSVSATSSAAPPAPTVAIIEPPSPPPPSWDEVKLKSNK
jgi:uncharacterized protein YlxW (UPF0749 family)